MKSVHFGERYLYKGSSANEYAQANVKFFKENEIEAKAVTIKDYRGQANFFKRFSVRNLDQNDYIVLTGRDRDPNAPKPTQQDFTQELATFIAFVSHLAEQVQSKKVISRPPFLPIPESPLDGPYRGRFNTFRPSLQE